MLLISMGAAYAQTFNVSDYGATGSANMATCSTQAGSNILTNCQTNTNDWTVGQVIHIKGGGPAPASRAFLNHGPISPAHYADPPISAPPTVTSGGDPAAPGTSGHRYCYSVSIADPLEGVSAPSPTTCTTNDNGHNALYASTAKADMPTSQEAWPSPVFLWYVNKDGGSYSLLGVTQAQNNNLDNGGNVDGGINDFGQAFAARPFTLSGAANTLPSRGGWRTGVSTPDVSTNEDLFATICAINGNQVTIKGIESHPALAPLSCDQLPSVQLGSTNSAAVIIHDDTQAVQHAIDAALNAGGGTVQFGAGTFNIQRPLFFDKASSPSYSDFTTDLASETYNFVGFAFLEVPNGSTGNVELAGLAGPTLSTILQTPPDQAGDGSVFFLGQYASPAEPGYPVLNIAPVTKGSTTVQVVGPSNANLQAGDDVLLFSGAFAPNVIEASPSHRSLPPPPCKEVVTTSGDLSVVSAGDCHYTELNTIASIDALGNYVLKYPASKNYYQDQLGSDFGMVKMPVTPHNVELYHMAVNTYDRIFGAGMAYGLTVDAVQINGYVSYGGAFGGGYKRDVLIKNSVWGVGDGEAGYAGEEEYDKFTNLQIVNNYVVGDAPASSFGPTQQARLYATEGTSQVYYYSNSFDNVSLNFDQTTDVLIDHNNFHEGTITLGAAFGQQLFAFGNNLTSSFVSFGSQVNAEVTSNNFLIDSGFPTPWVIRLGHFNNATIASNVITYNDAKAPAAMIFTDSGTVIENTIIAPAASSVVGIVAQPDTDDGATTQASSITVTENTINASNLQAAVLAWPGSLDMPEPSYTAPLSICVNSNTPSGSVVIQPPFAENPIPVDVSSCQ